MHQTRSRWLPAGTLLGSIVFILGALLFPQPGATLAGDLPTRADPAAPGQTTITVTTFDDEVNSDGDCSLREAVQAANTDSPVDACPAGQGADVILLGEGTYTLSIAGSGEDDNQTGDLDVSGALLVQGITAATTIIQAGPAAGEGIDRVFQVLEGADLTLDFLLVRHGRAGAGSGSDNDGGGVHLANGATLTLHLAAITDNLAERGGGIFNDGGNLMLVKSTIAQNQAGSDGGGIFTSGSATLNLMTLSGNSAADGAGLSVDSGNTTITYSAIHNNQASNEGGGIVNGGILTVINSTISNNSAVVAGGAHNHGNLNIYNSTVASNQGGGLLNSSAQLTLTDSLVADNTGGDCSGGITSNDFNLDSDGSCNLTASHDLPAIDPQLTTLGYYGGFNFTQILLATSPAIDAGNCSNGSLTNDQRDSQRPQGAGCDIGANENGLLAANDIFNAVEDTPRTILAPGVLANDFSWNPISVTLTLPPTSGNLVFNPDGSFVYTPAADFNGSDTFEYFATDGVYTDTAVATITVRPVNDTPSLQDDLYSTPEDTPLVVPPPGFLENDHDIDGDALHIVSYSGVVNGSLTVVPDGSFTYSPLADFYGVDGFSYILSDGVVTSTASVTITVVAVNDAPVALGETYTFTQGTAVSLVIAAPGVLENDQDVEGDALSAALLSGPAHGSLALHADGSFEYTPEPTYNGPDSFSYAADDGQALSEPVSVQLNIVQGSFQLVMPVILLR
jgi:CSLREA domain-containing protein